MRLAVTAVLLAGSVAVAAGQSAAPGAADARPLPSIGLVLPQIGLPLPRLGLPLPPIGLPPSSTPTDTKRRNSGVETGEPETSHRETSPPERSGHERGGREAHDAKPDAEGALRHTPRAHARRDPAVVYFVQVPGPTAATATGLGAPSTGATASAATEPTTGRLRLQLQPDRATQVYVDGVFVGTTDDLDSELPLDAGTHALEFRADGYESHAVDVHIVAGRSITYRGTLTAAATTPSPIAALAPAASEPSQPPAPTTVYVIPGCYIGNVAPKDARLPAGCDLGRAVVFAPPPR